MAMRNSDYNKEKKYALSHFLLVLMATIIVFFIIYFNTQSFNPDYLKLKMLFMGFLMYSFFHYILILRFPHTTVILRRLVLIVFDLAILTVMIFYLGATGIYLFAFYLLIVMEIGVSFGFVYFYFSVILTLASWAVLLLYSPYWLEHYSIVGTFAISTFLIPLLYLKQMRKMYQQQESLNETLLSTSHDANYDALTGLANRKMYDKYMKNLLKEKSSFSLLFIDLNKFKVINDTYGHDVGDEVLIEVARRLTASIDEEDMLARLGGDEFVIITKRKKVFLPKFIEKLEHTTIGRHQIDKVSVLIELSIGISLFPEDSKEEVFLRKYADEAMYVAKKAEGKYHIFYGDIKEGI